MTTLTPTGDLIMEVLAARYRLGEPYWTFHTRHRRALDELSTAGLIRWRHGPTSNSAQAYLTDAGKTEFLSGTYTPPAALAEAADLARHLRRIGDVVQEALAGKADGRV